MVGDSAQEQDEEGGGYCCDSYTFSCTSALVAAVDRIGQEASPMKIRLEPSSDHFIRCSSKDSARTFHVPGTLTISSPIKLYIYEYSSPLWTQNRTYSSDSGTGMENHRHSSDWKYSIDRSEACR